MASPYHNMPNPFSGGLYGFDVIRESPIQGGEAMSVQMLMARIMELEQRLDMMAGPEMREDSLVGMMFGGE